MKQPIKIDSFTPKLISQDYFLSILPEYYRLKNIIELQDWHDGQTVFNHSLDSARALQVITRFEYSDDDTRSTLNHRLTRVIDTHTRMELLRVATLLHDVGKIISLQQNSQGDTSSPSHGIIGRWIAEPLLERFDLSSNEKTFILELISDHLVPSDLIEMSINNNIDSHEMVVGLLQKNRPESSIELLLLAYADWMGCDVKESVKKARDRRVVIAHECLVSMAKTG